MSDIKNMEIEELLSKGKWNFILWRGVIGWGLPAALIFQLIMYFVNSNNSVSSLVGLIMSLIIFPACGFFVGKFMWRSINKKYTQEAS